MDTKIVTAHRALWGEVISQAVTDFVQGRLHRSYFRTRSFLDVCEYAGVEPNVVRAGIYAVTPQTWIDKEN